jgi:ribosome recycling factor
MNADQILREGRDRMDKSVQHLQRELRGIRTGRATTALIDSIKVDYYGSPTELRELAAISVPDPTLLVVKPFDPGSKSGIVRALETAELGFNPTVDGNTIRISVPPPSQERRRQLVAQVRKMSEEARVAIRNERREAIRRIDQLVRAPDSPLSEDLAESVKERVEDLTRDHTRKIDEVCERKVKEVEEV